MGIYGFWKHIKNHPEFGEKLDLAEFARNQKSPLVIVIDGSGLAYFLHHQAGTDAIRGGQYKDKFTENNIELHILFDGLRPESKTQTSVSRRRVDAETFQRTFKYISSNKMNTNSRTSKNMIPYFAFRAILEAAKLMKVKVVQCVEEADREIAKYCTENQYYAVLAQDTDFFIFDVPHYIPFSSLQFKNQSIKVDQYSTEKTSKLLRVDKRLLPLFACLSGNDTTRASYKLMSPIKWKLKSKGTNYTLQDISNYLTLNRNTPLKEIISELIETEENPEKTRELIEESIKQYDIHQISNEKLKYLDEISPEFSKFYSQKLVSVDLFLLLSRRDYFGEVIVQGFNTKHLGAAANGSEIRYRWYQIALGRPGKKEKEIVQEYIHDLNTYRRVLVEVEFREDIPNIITLQKSTKDVQLAELLKPLRSYLPSFFKIENIEKLNFMIAARFLSATQVIIDWQLYALIMLFLDCNGIIDLKINPDLNLLSAQATTIAGHYQLVLGHIIFINEVTGFPLGTNFCPWKFFDGFKWHILFKRFHKGRGQQLDAVTLKILNGYSSTEQVKFGELVKEMYQTITEGLLMKHVEVSEDSIKIKPGSTINANANNKFDLLDVVMEEE